MNIKQFIHISSLWFALTLIICGCATIGDGRGYGWHENSAHKKYSVREVTDVVRAGKKAVRFELREGDHWPGSGTYRESRDKSRTELSGHDRFKAKMGKDYWYGFSMLIPVDFPETPVQRCIIGQWHAVPDPGEHWRTPPLAQYYQQGVFYVFNVIAYSKLKTGIYIYISDDSFEKGVWHDFVYHIKWSHKDDGFVEMWLDGKQVANYKGPVGYNDSQGPYFKYGLYIIPSVKSKYVIYFDEYRRGKSYEEVDPAGNHYPE
jgi:hypothetical protein